MITVAYHENWVLLSVGSFYNSVNQQDLDLIAALRFILDLSDPHDGGRTKLNWDTFWPRTASSFNGQVLSDGFVQYRNHSFNDLVQLKIEGTLAAIPLRYLPFENDTLPAHYHNFYGVQGRYAQAILTGDEPICIGYEQSWSDWKGRPYTQLHCTCYWAQGPLRIISVGMQPPKFYRDGWIIGSEWQSNPEYSKYKDYSFTVRGYLHRGNGKWSRRDFQARVLLHHPLTISSLRSAFVKVCEKFANEWHVALNSERAYDPTSWFSRRSPGFTLKGGYADTPPSPTYDVLRDSLFPDPPNINWHEVASEAYQDLGMADINGVANIKELMEFGGTVTSFTKTLKSIPAKRVKAAAQAWLAVHYGFKLTLLDAKELYQTLNDWSYRRSSLSKCQADGTALIRDTTYSYRYQVFFDAFAELRSSLLQCVAISDAFLTLENTWDMVPWSFVIDWFVDIGSVLQSLDNWFNLRQRHDVVAVGRSIKAQRRVDASLLFRFGTGNFDVTWYRREYGTETISPSLTPSVTINPFNHLIEAAALIISIK